MPQVSWCPTSLLNLPLDELGASQNTENYLQIEDDLSLVGTWTRIPATNIPAEKYNWTGTHPLISPQLQLEKEENPESTFLLFEKAGLADRAILVKSKHSGSTPCYEYIGAVKFREAQDLGKGEIDVEVKLLGDINSNRNSADIKSGNQKQISNDS
jgi:hypothetical protein